MLYVVVHQGATMSRAIQYTFALNTKITVVIRDRVWVRVSVYQTFM